MGTKMTTISENTKVKLSFAVTLLGMMAGSLIWVGKIQARVDHADEERSEMRSKIDVIQGDTHYIRGVLDTMLNRK